MGTFNSFHVRTDGGSSGILSAIAERFPSAQVSVTSEFVGVSLSPDAFDPPASDLAGLSERFSTDVFWLGSQSTVDAFQFHHWHGGNHLRALVYGRYADERTWERADGTPESWERDVFFDPASLDDALEFTDPSEHSELRRIWRDAEIRAGRTEPGLAASSVAHRVGEIYRFPFYVPSDKNA